jgi:hypothetical protein
MARPPQLTITPDERDFGMVPLGDTSEVATFEIKNVGDMPVGPLATTLSPVESPFLIAYNEDGCSGVTLMGQESCTVGVVFSPHGRAQQTATLAVSDGNDIFRVEARLSGTGVPASFQITPSSHTFAAGFLTPAPEQEFTVTNTSSFAAAIGEIGIGGPDKSFFALVTHNCDAPIDPGKSCKATVRYNFMDTAVRTATLDVFGSISGGASAMLTGTFSTNFGLEILPASHDFGMVVFGSVNGSAVQVFDVFNRTNKDLFVSVSTFDPEQGDNEFPSQFVIVPIGVDDQCSGRSTPLGPGAHCKVGVKFFPRSAGPKTGELRASAPDGAPTGEQGPLFYTGSSALRGTGIVGT